MLQTQKCHDIIREVRRHKLYLFRKENASWLNFPGRTSLRMVNIERYFGSVCALKNINFEVGKNEIVSVSSGTTVPANQPW